MYYVYSVTTYTVLTTYHCRDINSILLLYVINTAFNCLWFTLIVLFYCILDLSPTQVDV
jgi:hypothetical protein